MARRRRRTTESQYKNPAARKPRSAQPNKSPSSNHPAESYQRALNNEATPEDLLNLQETAGNQAVSKLMSPSTPGSPPSVQAKLSLGQADDEYEKQADSAAANVMAPEAASPTHHTQNTEQPAESGFPSSTPQVMQQPKNEEEVARKPTNTPSATNTASGNGDSLGRGFESQLGQGGKPLAGNTRAFMEQRLGADFSGVRVHADNTADTLSKSIQAEAFTHGRDVYFRGGNYQPESTEGKKLLAHELTHVVQQTGGQMKQDEKSKGPQG